MDKNLKLREWQKVIVDCINSHEEFISEQSFQSLSDYEINKLSEIKGKFPRDYGHTTLAAYITANYPSLFIYANNEHLTEIQTIQSAFGLTMHKDTEVLSIFELLYTLSHTASVRAKYYVNLDSIKNKFNNKKVVVIDKATLMPGGIEEIENIILTISKGCVVFLG
jgi:hypothetical protein